LTEREALRGSKSGMRFSSPKVRGFECADDCIDVLTVISVPFRSPRLGRGPHQLIQSVSVAGGALSQGLCLL
jgi:hypothetical protein